MDVGLTSHTPGQTGNDRTASWAQILVTGELKSNAKKINYVDTLIDLATYTREVFRAQYRRFVLGFTLCGSRMRLWHFDRSGSAASQPFDINSEGLQFVRVIIGYHLMNDKQLGLDPMIQQQPDGQQYVEITRDDQIERLILTEEIKRPAVIAGRATTCWGAYCAQDQWKKPLIVKTSWQYEERPEEGELIKEATENNVEHIARYYHHETVQVDGKNDDTIENVRRGMLNAEGRIKFTQKSSSKPSAAASEPRRESVAGQNSNLRKRPSSANQMVPSKRSCLGSPPEPTIHNRVHRLIITRDPGKPIWQASSPGALLTGLVGAIKGEALIMSIESIANFTLGHESSLNAGILHRDVSIGNIMLTEDENDGFLIDFDLAIKTASIEACGAPGKTGTKVFMAIGALSGDRHTFRHDLESFWWVLFWLCKHLDGLTGEGEGKFINDKLYESWNYYATEELAKQKTGVVSKRFFDTDVTYTECCKPLIPCLKKLHK
ncbi:MAG: hypothetical protein LQ341_007200, partial [Variospora aurantia]